MQRETEVLRARLREVDPSYQPELDRQGCCVRPITRPTVDVSYSVTGLVSKMWYLVPFNQSELSISKIPWSDWVPILE
jgi:hypothetical protein